MTELAWIRLQSANLQKKLANDYYLIESIVRRLRLPCENPSERQPDNHSFKRRPKTIGMWGLTATRKFSINEFLPAMLKVFLDFPLSAWKSLSFSKAELSQDIQVITNCICWRSFSCSCRSNNATLESRESWHSSRMCVRKVHLKEAIWVGLTWIIEHSWITSWDFKQLKISHLAWHQPSWWDDNSV